MDGHLRIIKVFSKTLNQKLITLNLLQSSHLKYMRVGVPTPHTVKHPCLTLQSALHQRFRDLELYNHRLCNPIVYTIEKKFACKWTSTV